MATNAIVLYRGAASTGSSTLYTAAATTVVTEILATNTSASTQTFSISLNGTTIVNSSTITANSTAFLTMKQVLPSGQILAGNASATSVNFSISGVTIV